MGVTYSADVKNARLQAVANAIDAGSGPGVIELGTAGMAAILATIALADPCGEVSGGVLTFTMPRSDTSADNSGVAAAARIKDSDGNIKVSTLTVGGTAEGTAAGKDIVLAASTISAGQTVSITAAAITHA